MYSNFHTFIQNKLPTNFFNKIQTFWTIIFIEYSNEKPTQIQGKKIKQLFYLNCFDYVMQLCFHYKLDVCSLHF